MYKYSTFIIKWHVSILFDRKNAVPINTDMHPASNPAQRRYQIRDINMLINVLEHINAYGIWAESQHPQWKMPNHVDEIDSTIGKAHTAWYARYSKSYTRH